jgi:hypothetical protein
MLNWFGIILLILVVLVAWRLWSSGSFEGAAQIFGGAAKKESKESFAFKDFQSYTITEPGNFVRVSYNDNSGDKSLLVLYNNGTLDKDGKVAKGDVQISFKIANGELDKEAANLEGVDKLSDVGKAIIKKSIDALKPRLDEKTIEAVETTLPFLKS